MKKILVIIMITVLIRCITFKTYASSSDNVNTPLIIVEGEYVDIDTTYDGYKLISTTLNTKVPGKYYSVYENYFTKEEVIKEIFVISKEEALNDKYSIEDLIDSTNINYDVLKYEKIDNGKYIVISSTETGEEDKINLDVVMIDKNNTLWTKEIYHNCYGEIRDLKIIDNKVIVIGNVYFKYSGMDIMVYELDLLTGVNKRIFYGGTKNENVLSIEKDNGYYYVVGTTLSTKGEIIGSGIDEDSFILKLDQNLKKVNLISINKEGKNTPLSLLIDKEDLYIVEQHIGSLAHTLNIIKIDNDLQIIKEQKVDIGYLHNVNGLVKINNNIYLIREKENLEHNQRNLYIESIDDELNITSIYKDIYNDDKSIKDVFIKDNNISLLFKTSKSYNTRILDIDKKEIISDYDYLLNNNQIKLTSLNQVSIYHDKKISEYIYYNVKIDSLNNLCINEDDTYLYDTSVLLDKEIVKLNIDKSTLNYDMSLFGIYDNIFYFTGENIELVYKRNIQVMSNLKLINNGIYDKGLKLKFNGIGLLNNEEILSGYVIDKVGLYTFKLIGKDNQSITYNFEVADLSIDSSSTNKPSYNTTKTKEDYISGIISSSNKVTNNITVSCEVEQNDRSNVTISYWPLLIPLSLGMICTILILRGGR